MHEFKQSREKLRIKKMENMQNAEIEMNNLCDFVSTSGKINIPSLVYELLIHSYFAASIGSARLALLLQRKRRSSRGMRPLAVRLLRAACRRQRRANSS